jgi:AcrR family transcriptional regulator
MARQQHTDSADTVEKIIEAAHAILETEELTSISLRKVARQASLSAGTVTYYFASAEALWEACLEAHFVRVERFLAGYVREVAEGCPAREVFSRAAHDAYRFALQERPMLRLILAMSARRGGLSGRQRQQSLSNLRRLATLLTEGQEVRIVLGIQSLVFAYARFACASIEDRLAMTGAATEADADEIIAAELASFAAAVLLPSTRG